MFVDDDGVHVEGKCAYIYMYMYTYTCIPMCTCVYVCSYIHIYIHVYQTHGSKQPLRKMFVDDDGVHVEGKL
jgi:hypothetical protein